MERRWDGMLLVCVVLVGMMCKYCAVGYAVCGTRLDFG